MTGAASILLLATACSDRDKNEQTPGEGSIVVSLNGEKINQRATGPTTDNETDERKIVNFRIYVFNNSSGAVEKVVNGEVTDGKPNPTTITGLNILTSKKIVVLANIPDGYGAVSHYSDFETYMLDLNTQTPHNRATKGLAMSGESEEFTLTNEDVNGTPKGISVTIKRVVAKVKLESILISPTSGRAGVFELTSVSIQKAKSLATIGPVDIASSKPYYGGIASTESTVQASYLIDNFTTTPPTGTTEITDNYFYVFPNEVEGEETLMTISGTYDGAVMHFPFQINAIASEGGGTADGKLIKRNTQYQLAVTLRNLGGGSTDPDVPGEEADVEIIVTTEGWEGPLTQNVEW